MLYACFFVYCIKVWWSVNHGVLYCIGVSNLCRFLYISLHFCVLPFNGEKAVQAGLLRIGGTARSGVRWLGAATSDGRSVSGSQAPTQTACHGTHFLFK